MATTAFQRGVLRLLAPSRKERESYVAGGVALSSADAICEALPVEAVGTCVVSTGAELFRGDLEALQEALRSQGLCYHHGTIGGAWPTFPSA